MKYAKVEINATAGCLYCSSPLQKKRGWEFVDLCLNASCDPHGSGDPRRCPECGCGHFLYAGQNSGVTRLRCSVCDSFFESYAVTKRQPMVVPERV
jgi:hypothetical protein